MNQVLLVSCGQAVRQLYSQTHDFARRQRAAGNLGIEIETRNVLGDQEVHSLVPAELVNRGHIGMIQACQQQCFFAEAAAGGVIVQCPRRENLYGDVAVQFFVVSAIHHPHAARANLLEDSIMLENLPDHMHRSKRDISRTKGRGEETSEKCGRPGKSVFPLRA